MGWICNILLGIVTRRERKRNIVLILSLCNFLIIILFENIVKYILSSFSSFDFQSLFVGLLNHKYFPLGGNYFYLMALSRTTIKTFSTLRYPIKKTSKVVIKATFYWFSLDVFLLSPEWELRNWCFIDFLLNNYV